MDQKQQNSAFNERIKQICFLGKNAIYQILQSFTRKGACMQPKIKRMADVNEFETKERCFISEIANDPEDEQVSIARARVKPGEVTAWHKLLGITERYIITKGRGIVEVADCPATPVKVGDVVIIPPGSPQRIRNVGDTNLVFFAVCTPRFIEDAYVDLDSDIYIPCETSLR